MASEDLLFYRDRILERIEKLRSFLNDHQPVMAELMTVGTVTRHEERLKEVNPIEVSTISDASVDEIIRVIQDFCIDDIDVLSRNSTKVTNKYPGLIIVPEGAEQLSGIICDINDAKSDFASAMKRVNSEKHIRFKEVHRKLPGLVTAHSTRKILFVEEQLKKVTFAWRLNRNQVKTNASDLIAMLDKRRLVAVKSPVTTDLTVVANIDRAKALLERKVLRDGEGYRLCRTNTFPVPIAHLFTYRPEGKERGSSKYAETDYKVVKASLPIFGVGQKPTIKRLQDWVPAQDEALSNGRRSNHSYTELVPGADLGIFIMRKV
ncbi:DNA replication terminus site-binding protein [Salmonella enterica subsp. enterica serovar Typhimurium]|uniref:DNA replication terminus site-binding protein n=1 Tax=Salmonella enterica TaxID=28901 RepID=UPI002FFACBB8